MPLSRTETVSDRYRGIDTWPAGNILAAIAEAQVAAVEAVREAVPALTVAAESAAKRVGAGGRLIYAGAGSSGLLAQLDALELPGTYGLAPEQIIVLLAGGDAALHRIPGDAEDDEAAARAAVDRVGAGDGDVLVALSASGTTRFAVAALLQAHARGVLTIGIACNDATPLLMQAHYPVLLATPPEVIAGSTRMNAGTAQKCALNMLSTLIGIRLGHGYDGMMVNVRAENEKLRGRAIGIVARVSGVDEARANSALAAADNDVKIAILLCAGARDWTAADELLRHRDGDLRTCLGVLATAERSLHGPA